jgi:molybdopterin/thiamine biosynthesis adenylyltransferase
MAAKAFFSKSAMLEHANVARIDAAWVTTRGGAGFVKELSNAKLSVIGAGSLGATVCKLLVKAGASHLRVLDPEVLTLDNIARHELGARYVGRAKATALAESLMLDYPYADVTGNNDRWEDVERRRPGFIDGSDVVISTTGNFASEAQLNLSLMNRSAVRLRIYAWFEAYAAAAHCLVLLPGDCLGCSMNEFGLFKGAVTEFETEVVRVPGCADAFQPYGEIDAMPAKAFITHCIVDAIIAAPRASAIYTWIGARSILEKYSGAIRSTWLDAHNVPPEAGTTIVGAWERDPNCRLCQKVAS